jgi:hypothetical protein
MTNFRDLFGSAWRYFETDGVPASGPHRPNKVEITLIGAALDAAIASAIQGMAAYSTKTALLASPVPANGTQTRVFADPTSTNNGVYVYNGSWAIDTGFYSQLATIIQPLVDQANAAASAAAASAAALAKLPKPYPSNGNLAGGVVGIPASITVPITALTDTLFNSYGCAYAATLGPSAATGWAFTLPSAKPALPNDTVALSFLASIDDASKWPTGNAISIGLREADNTSHQTTFTTSFEALDSLHRRYHVAVKNTYGVNITSVVANIANNGTGNMAITGFAVLASQNAITDLDWRDWDAFSQSATSTALAALKEPNGVPLFPTGPYNTIGDSMIHGLNSSVTPLATQLTTTTGVPWNNGGTVGLESIPIVAQFGAIPIILSVTGDTLPGGGAQVLLTALNIQPINNTGPDIIRGPGVGTAPGSPPRQLAIRGYVNGAYCLLQRDIAGNAPSVPPSNYHLERVDGGGSVALPPNSVFIPENSATYNNSLAIARFGYNDTLNHPGAQSLTNLIAAVQALCTWSKPLFKRLLILDPPTSYYSAAPQIADLNNQRAWLQANADALGFAYLPVQSYVSSNQIFIDAGMTPPAAGSNDAQAIIDGRSTLALTLDGLHDTTTQVTMLMNNRILPALRSRKWIV